MNHITRQDLKDKIERKDPLYLVEAQSSMMYDDAHLPGALNIPPNRVAELAPRLLPDKDVEVVVYCSGPT